MKRKLLLSILICVLIIFTFTLSSCNDFDDAPEDHECEWGAWKTTKQPTCFEEGLMVIECIHCGKVLESKSIDILKHQNDKWETTKEPTCSAEGEKVLKCSLCGTKHSSESIPTTDHSFVEGNCSACGITDPKLFTFSDLNNGTYMISAKDPEKIPAVIHIPSEYNGKPVVGINMYGFKDCTALREITIPDSVVIICDGAFKGTALYTNKENWENGVLYIGDILIEAVTALSGEYTIKTGTTVMASGAFFGCEGLTKINIPESIISIPPSAFSGCINLTDVNLPPILFNIGSGAFANCSSLQEISLPSTVLDIGQGAFRNCTSLSSITIPQYLEVISYRTFMGCTSLTSIILPDSVGSIGESAFEDCTNLKYVDTGNSLYVIGENAFKGCTSLENITISPILAHISSGSFKNCTSLTKIDLPDSVDYSIRHTAFEGCEKLKTIKISDKVIIIEASAFSFCRGLESVVIGERVRTIDPGAFFGCDSLNNVFYKGTANKWDGVQISDIGNDKLSEAQMYFYSEEAPEEEGFFWHYGENGEILIWE